MSQITFAVDFSQSFSRGVSCPLPPTVTIEVDPAKLTQEERELIASRLTDGGVVQSYGLSSYSDAPYARSTSITGSSSAVPVTADEPTIAGVLAAIRREDAGFVSEIEARRAKKAAEEQESIEFARAWLASSADSRVVQGGTRYVAGYGHVADWVPSSSYSPDYQHLENAKHKMPEIETAIESLRAEANRRNQAVLDEIDAARKAEAAARESWIAAHGSARLKRLVAEGIPHAKTYETERAKYAAAELAAALATSRPGWFVVAESDLDYAAVADVSLRTLALLDAARVIAPAAKLAKQKSTGRFVAVEEFCGKLIAWPRD